MLYQTHATVHLGNIHHNIQWIRDRVGKQRKILIAVKANAYGHGAVEVSRMAEKIGVDWLGVATVPEAMQLRKAGINLPILKFSPAFPEEMKAAILNNVTLAVCDIENIHTLQLACAAISRRINVHLKVDTGMGRIGVPVEEAAEMAIFIEHECPSLNLDGVFTHLPVSDKPDDAYTKEQISRFSTTVDGIQSAIGRRVPLVHCANSGAVLAFPDAWFDMVRPGIMIYGFYPGAVPADAVDLRPGLSFSTRVSFIKQVKKGTSIGYGRTWIAPENCTIATFPAGYADGFNRLFSNTGCVLINGRSYPVVGRVCMDQSMCNVGSAIDIRVGDEVVLIGKSGPEEITAYEWADKLGTITYEVTCQINSRVPRYFEPY